MGGDKGNPAGGDQRFMQSAVGVGGGYNPYANNGGQYGGGMRDPIRQRPGPPSFMQNAVGVGGGYNPYANSGGQYGGMISPPSVWNPQPRGPGGRPRNSPFYPPTPRYSIGRGYGQPGPPPPPGGGWLRSLVGGIGGMQPPPPTGGDVNGTGKMSAARAAYADSLGSADPMAAAKAAYATGGGAAAMAAPVDPMAAAKAAYATGGGAAALAAMQEAQAAAAPDPQPEFVPQKPYYERVRERQQSLWQQRQQQRQQAWRQQQDRNRLQRAWQQQQQQQRPWQLFNNGGLVRGYQDGGPVGAPPQDDAMAMLRQALMSGGLGGAMSGAGAAGMAGAGPAGIDPAMLAEIMAQQGGGR